MKRCLWCLGLVLMVLSAGCGEDKSPAPNSGENDSAPGQTPAPEDLGPPLAGEPVLSVLDWDETLELVRTHPGKVVVVHLWASWSDAKEEWFEELVRLQKLHREDVIALSVNTDYSPRGKPPESSMDSVQAFAKKHGANFQHVISRVPDEDLQDQLEIFGMPAVLVFDKAGQKRHTFFQEDEDDPFSYREDVIPAVESLLKENIEATAPKATVSVQIRDWAGLEALIAEERGRVVVVDVWSTSCPPCVEEFPNLVKLHRAHPNDVACISFNLDYIGLKEVEALKPHVLDFLQRQQATFPNVMSSEPDEALLKRINLASMPAVYVYDRQGKQRKRFDEESGERFTYAKDIVPFVEQLLKE